jgi:acetolactate synthase I/II/III large subunit
MASVNGGELMVRTLAEAGVREIFALSGGHLNPIFRACRDHGIRLIDTRHEEAAAHMADGYARATGRPGVALVTAGPGVTNAITGVANAFVDAVPMICIAGRSPLRDEDRLPLQSLDQVALMQPVTKYARTVLHSDRIPEYMAASYRHAVSGRPGPVFLDVPIDILYASVEEDDVPLFNPFPPAGRPAADPASVARAVEALLSAERPAILAGGGAWFSGAQDEVRELAELGRIPVLTNAKARGIVSERTELGYGGFGLLGSPAVHAAGGGPPDVVLLLGARVGMFTGSSSGRGGVIPDGATVIQVDVEAEEIGRTRNVQLGLAGDVRETVRAIIERARGQQFRDHEPWIAALCAARDAVRHVADDVWAQNGGPIHQVRLMREIADFVTGEDIIIADGGDTSGWIAEQTIIESAGRWMSHGYLGCLGTGIPFGLAAQVAHPDRRVITVIGDGSVGLNFAEFDTAVRHDLPLVVVVNNDLGWGMVRHDQNRQWGKGEAIGTELGPTRYERAAEGFGVHAEFVQCPDEIRPALERAFASGKPSCINVLTDPELSPQAYRAGRQAAPAPRPAPPERDGKEEVELPYYGRRRL